MNRETTQRLIIRAVLLTGVVLFGVWIARNTYWGEIVVPTPLKGEAATDTQYAVKKFLESLNVKVEAHESFTSLPPTDAAIVLNNWHWDLIDSRRDKIEAWVRAGGRLIVDPTVVGIFERYGFGELTGIERRIPEPVKPADAAKRARAEKDELEEECPLWKVTIDSDGASGAVDRYSLCKILTFGWLISHKKPNWAVRDKRGLQAVRVPIDRGDVTVINASPFGNRDFRDVQRGALLVAALQLRHGDRVWLLTEADHPSLLTLIWQYGAPVVILFALFVAAICWRNAIRFGPLGASEDRARRSLAEQIRGTGWFILRLGGTRVLYSATLRALKETANRRITRFSVLTPEQQVAALVAHTSVEREALQEALYPTATESGVLARRQTRHQLYRAISTLETARRALANDQSISRGTEVKLHSTTREATHAN